MERDTQEGENNPCKGSHEFVTPGIHCQLLSTTSSYVPLINPTMSHESRPISPTRFTSALKDLPVSSLYAKTFEIRNSIAHLYRSNTELQSYSDGQQGGDADCLQAIRENTVVIERNRERIELLRAEVERRGQRWHENDESGVIDFGGAHVNGEDGVADGNVAGVSQPANGVEGHSARNGQANTRGGRLNDEDLRREVYESMGNADAEDDQEGMHL